MANTDCQAYFFYPGYGYFYYTGKDSEGKTINDSHNGTCTENNGITYRGKGENVLYIKKNQ